MKDILASISRILEVDRATDMEAALFVLQQMDLAAELRKGHPIPDDIPVLSIARELLNQMENPFARKLLRDRLIDYPGKSPDGDRFSEGQLP